MPECAFVHYQFVKQSGNLLEISFNQRGDISLIGTHQDCKIVQQSLMKPYMLYIHQTVVGTVVGFVAFALLTMELLS